MRKLDRDLFPPGAGPTGFALDGHEKLTECGIHWTLDKRDWITTALKLIPNLDVDDHKQPWRFVRLVHDHLGRMQS